MTFLFSNSKKCKTFGPTLTHLRGKAISPRTLKLSIHHKYNVQTAWKHRLNKNIVLKIDHLWRPKKYDGPGALAIFVIFELISEAVSPMAKLISLYDSLFLILHTFLTHIHKKTYITYFYIFPFWQDFTPNMILQF